MTTVERLKTTFYEMLEDAIPIGKSDKNILAGKFEVYGWRLTEIAFLIRDLRAEELREAAIWQHGSYIVPVQIGGRIHEVLGRVSMTNDGRWKWVRSESDYHKNGIWNGMNQQGCEETQEEAMKKVIEGWKL